MKIYLTILLCILAFSSYAVMYVLQFRYAVSIFARFKNYKYWNPFWSHFNKWKLDGSGFIIERNGKRVERFFGSSTVFVFLTDAWHLFQFIFENSVMLAIGINIENYKFYYSFLGIRVIYAITFNSLFDIFLIQKGKKYGES